MMKTLFFVLGLLITACCSNALPSAVEFNTAPRRCCFQFSSKDLSLKRVSNITKIHHSCNKKGFIVETIIGRKICYEENFQWAQNVYNQLHPEPNVYNKLHREQNVYKQLHPKGSGCGC